MEIKNVGFVRNCRKSVVLRFLIELYQDAYIIVYETKEFIGGVMKEKALELEYNNIKQEIFILMQRCDNLIISIYTVSITLMGLGYELNNKYFFALIIIFIIPMHGLLNVRRYHMARCSTYIALCLESPSNNLSWETMVSKIDIEFKKLYQKGNVIYKLTSALVGGGMSIIASASILFMHKKV